MVEKLMETEADGAVQSVHYLRQLQATPVT